MVVPAAALLVMAPVEVLGELRRQPVEESGAAGLLQVLGGHLDAPESSKVEGERGEFEHAGRGGGGETARAARGERAYQKRRGSVDDEADQVEIFTSPRSRPPTRRPKRLVV